MDDDKLDAIMASLNLAELAEVNVMLTTPQLRMLIEEITRLRAELERLSRSAGGPGADAQRRWWKKAREKKEAKP